MKDSKQIQLLQLQVENIAGELADALNNNRKLKLTVHDLEQMLEEAREENVRLGGCYKMYYDLYVEATRTKVHA